jgi:hypothetical protein
MCTCKLTLTDQCSLWQQLLYHKVRSAAPHAVTRFIAACMHCKQLICSLQGKILSRGLVCQYARCNSKM